MSFINQRLSIFVCFILVALNVTSQRNYTPLKCVGEIPSEFRTLTAAKVQKAQAEERKNKHTSQEKARVNDFLLKNNYVIDELLTSGKVLFGDSLSLYISEIADLLLENDKELRSNLRFYILKSTEANAFATNQGIIFITVGLLAQIENEAQLAFVLAHEIAHFEKKHSIASVLENQRIYDETKNDRYNSYNQRIKLLSAFSKDMEFQADSLGFVRLTNSGYKKEAASTMMDVLQWSFLPFEDAEFTTTFLELDSLKIPSSFQLDSLAQIPLFTDDSDDSKSSHPNIRKRREAIELMIERAKASSGKLYQLGKLRFEEIQYTARKETIHLDFLDSQYIDGLYSALSLLKKHPNDQYLEESIGKALYGISKYKNSNDFSDIGAGSDDTFSHIQNCFYLFETLSDQQVNLIAIRYLFYLNDKYPSDFGERLLNNLIAEGLEENDVSFDGIEGGLKRCREAVAASKIVNTSVAENSTSSEPIQAMNDTSDEREESDSKYAKLREVKKQATTSAINNETSEDEENPWNDMFHFRAFESYDLTKVAERFKKIKTQIDAQKKADDEWTLQLSKKEKYYKRHGYALDIDKVVFVDPFYFELDQRKGLHLVDSEKEMLDFKNQIATCSSTCDLDCDVLCPKSMGSGDVSNYNDMACMNDWIGEKLNHEKEDVKMIPLQTQYSRELAESYGSPYFCFTGIYANRFQRENRRTLLYIGCLIWPTLPIMAVLALTPQHQTNFFFLLYNISTGETKWVLDKSINKSANNGNINSLLYDTIYQVKKEKKHKH